MGVAQPSLAGVSVALLCVVFCCVLAPLARVGALQCPLSTQSTHTLLSLRPVVVDNLKQALDFLHEEFHNLPVDTLFQLNLVRRTLCVALPASGDLCQQFGVPLDPLLEESNLPISGPLRETQFRMFRALVLGQRNAAFTIPVVCEKPPAWLPAESVAKKHQFQREGETFKETEGDICLEKAVKCTLSEGEPCHQWLVKPGQIGYRLSHQVLGFWMMELENCGEMFPDTRNIRQSLLWHMLADHQWRKVPLRI